LAKLELEEIDHDIGPEEGMTLLNRPDESNNRELGTGEGILFRIEGKLDGQFLILVM